MPKVNKQKTTVIENVDLSSASDVALKLYNKKNRILLTNPASFLVPSEKTFVETFTQFVGKRKFVVKKSTNVINKHLHYVHSIINNGFGFLLARNVITYRNVLNNINEILVQLFIAILRYNNILHYAKIKIGVVETNMILGEPMIYVINHATEALHLYVNPNLIEALVIRENTFSIKFSEEILNFPCKIRTAFETLIRDGPMQQDFINEANASDIEKIMLKLFIIADHTATHYIQEYIKRTTDWINHIDFTEDLSGFTTTALAFRISAALQANINTPRIAVKDSRHSDEAAVLSSLLGETKNYNINTIAQITDNISHLIPINF